MKKLLVVTVFLASMVTIGASAVNAAVLTGGQTQAIESIIDETMKNSNAPGALLGIWKGNEEPCVIAKGYADLAAGRKIKTEDGYRVGSVTKTFVATVVMQLCAEKKLDLDDKLSKYIVTLPNADKITIRQLLNMTAGLPEVFANPVFGRWCDETPEKAISPYDLYYFISTGNPLFDPGTRCVYDNSNYYVLGMIIEQVTHQPVGAVINERIIKPLKLSSTYYPESIDLRTPYAKG